MSNHTEMIERDMRLYLRDARRRRQMGDTVVRPKADRVKARQIDDAQHQRKMRMLRYLEKDFHGPVDQWDTGITLVAVPQCRELRGMIERGIKKLRCRCNDCTQWRQRFWTVPRGMTSEGSHAMQDALSRAAPHG